MTRRCSHCGRNGHNSRTCPDRGIKLFGVRLTSNSGLSMMRSFSMGNISQCPANTPAQSDSGGSGGYVSDSLTLSTSKCCERKKGVPWSEEEHRRFLVGLGTVGKGDWRGISRNFVPTRTPAQVASHAQKYFLRQSNLNKRKRRSSLFDISADLQRSTGLYLGRSRESIEQKQAILPRSSGFLGPGSFSIGIDGINSFPIPLWADLGMEPPSNLPVSATCNKFIWSEAKLNNSAKPTSNISPFLAATDESVEHGTQLSLSIAPPSPDPPSSSLNLDHQSSRHSALHSSKMYTFQWKSKQCYQSGLECLIHSVI